MLHDLSTHKWRLLWWTCNLPFPRPRDSLDILREMSSPELSFALKRSKRLRSGESLSTFNTCSINNLKKKIFFTSNSRKFTAPIYKSSVATRKWILINIFNTCFYNSKYGVIKVHFFVYLYIYISDASRHAILPHLHPLTLFFHNQ